jgi:hypothetical protein
LLYGAAFVMSVIGWVIGLSAEKAQERKAVRRAAWTANLTITLPGILVLILNLSLWQGLISVAAPPEGPQHVTASVTSDPPSLHDRIVASPLWNTSHEPCWGNEICQKFLYLGAKEPHSVVATVRSLFAESQTPPYCVALLALAFAMGLMIWTIIPAVVAEIFVRRTRLDSPGRPLASAWLGESLSAGFSAMRVSGKSSATFSFC